MMNNSLKTLFVALALANNTAVIWYCILFAGKDNAFASWSNSAAWTLTGLVLTGAGIVTLADASLTAWLSRK